MAGPLLTVWWQTGLSLSLSPFYLLTNQNISLIGLQWLSYEDIDLFGNQFPFMLHLVWCFLLEAKIKMQFHKTRWWRCAVSIVDYSSFGLKVAIKRRKWFEISVLMATLFIWKPFLEYPVGHARIRRFQILCPNQFGHHWRHTRGHPSLSPASFVFMGFTWRNLTLATTSGRYSHKRAKGDKSTMVSS